MENTQRKKIEKLIEIQKEKDTQDKNASNIWVHCSEHTILITAQYRYISPTSPVVNENRSLQHSYKEREFPNLKHKKTWL